MTLFDDFEEVGRKGIERFPSFFVFVIIWVGSWKIYLKRINTFSDKGNVFLKEKVKYWAIWRL